MKGKKHKVKVIKSPPWFQHIGKVDDIIHVQSILYDKRTQISVEFKGKTKEVKDHRTGKVKTVGINEPVYAEIGSYKSLIFINEKGDEYPGSILGSMDINKFVVKVDTLPMDERLAIAGIEFIAEKVTDHRKANKYFLKYSEKVAPKFSSLEKDLKKSNAKFILKTYLSMAMMSTAIAFVVGILVYIFYISYTQMLRLFMPVFI